MIKRRSKKRGPVTSKAVEADGIKFASGLEKHMYLCLKKAGIKAKYEGETFTLLHEFNFENSCWERQSNGKGEFRDRGNTKVRSMKYTPDFIGEDFIIECKGRANDSFPLRWKLFKNYVAGYLPNVTLYKPQKKDECQEVVDLILKSRA